jgi:hypothetical protein
MLAWLGLLDRVQNVAVVVIEFGRPNEQMGMFGHDDVYPNVEAVFGASPVNRFDQPLSTSIFAQERLSTKTRKGEGMGFAGIVVSFARLSVVHGPWIVSCPRKAVGMAPDL